MHMLFSLIIFLLPILFLLTKSRRRSSQNVPLGSLGEKWLEARVRKYGPISKLSLFGNPTVFIFGQAANKFIFTSDGKQSLRMILGDRCLLELSGEDHKRFRDALVSFLKPESLKQYVGKMDEEIKKHIQNHWFSKNEPTSGGCT